MKMRSEVVFCINSKEHRVSGSKALMTLSDYLRYESSLTGTKVVCAEGDCGACTVNFAASAEMDSALNFKTINSCIAPLFSLDGGFVVTVEGLGKTGKLHPVQESLFKCFGSQCGYCTPGFVCSMVDLVDDSIHKNKAITEKRAKNYLTGNLCRCTGYDPILKACTTINLRSVTPLTKKFHDPKVIGALKKISSTPVKIEGDNFEIFLPTTAREALKYKKQNPEARIVAGATDLGVVVNKGRLTYEKVLSLQNISSLWQVDQSKTHFKVGARATLSQLSNLFAEHFPEMENMLHIFASPQIKNSATLIGNVANGSPIADTIPFLMAVGAKIEAQSLTGTRLIPIEKFYLGYKKLNLKRTELILSIHIPKPQKNEFLKLYKASVRKDLDISAVTLASFLKIENAEIQEIRLAVGGVGPIVQRLYEIEKKFLGKKAEPKIFKDISEIIEKHVNPISDVRGSKEYRLQLCKNLFKKLSYDFSAAEIS